MVSIVVPVYNTSQYLRQALDSLLNQTYHNLQIICINDGSSDNSLNILEEYAQRDNRVHIITQTNEGISATRNRGLTEVKGRYVMFLDSDDWLDSDTIEKAYQQITHQNVDVVLWGYCKEYAKNSVPVQVWKEQKIFKGGNMRDLVIRLIGLLNNELASPALLDSLGTVWGKLYKTELFSEVRFTDTQIIGSAEDVLLNIEIFSRAKSACYCSDIWYHYRKDNKASFTKIYRKKLLTQWENLFNRMKSIIEKYHLGNLAYIALENRKALAFIGLGLNELSNIDNRGWERIRILIKTPWLHSAIVSFNTRQLPLHWHFFYWCAKKQFYIPVYFMLKSIRLLINRT